MSKNDAVEGLAIIGRGQAIIGAIIGTIVALVLLAVGIGKLRDKHTAVVDGIVTKSNCITHVGDTTNGHPTQNCVFDASYSVNNEQHVAQGLQSANQNAIIKGQKVPIRYDPKNPADSKYELPPIEVGVGLILGALLLATISIGWATITMRSKEAAAIGGGIGILDAVTSRL